MLLPLFNKNLNYLTISGPQVTTLIEALLAHIMALIIYVFLSRFTPSFSLCAHYMTCAY